MSKNRLIDQTTQVAIPLFTIGAQVLLALKHPQWALVANLVAQPFWFYSSWKAYKQAGQAGILVTTIIFTVVTIVGLVNYWA